MRFRFHELKQELMPAVMLAGGLETRLQPLTVTKPKAMVEVNGRAISVAPALASKTPRHLPGGAVGGLPEREDPESLLGTIGATRQT